MPIPLSSKNRWEQMSDSEKLDFLYFVCAELYRVVDSQTMQMQAMSRRLANIEEKQDYHK